MQSPASVIHSQSHSTSRKYSRNSEDRSPNRQKLACMDCQAVFYADISTCTYCDSELKKITPDQAKNCLNCGEMIRKRCRKCPFCHYNYGIFTFGRWLCNNCGRCNTARTPACLGCNEEKPSSSKKYNILQLYTIYVISLWWKTSEISSFCKYSSKMIFLQPLLTPKLCNCKVTRKKHETESFLLTERFILNKA